MKVFSWILILFFSISNFVYAEIQIQGGINITQRRIGGNNNFSFSEINNIGDLIVFLSVILNSLIPILIGLAVLFFLWGLITYFNTKDEAGRKKAISYITYGIISLFVMVSVWGLVNVLVNTFVARNPNQLPIQYYQID